MYDRNRRSTDQSEAQALRFQRDTIDIYSNSWGPGDMGWRVQGPGPLLKEVLRSGTQWGRKGKGSIFVFSAGNGGISGDSCAFNGYVNSIYTIGISAVNWDGSLPQYNEQCASIMAVTYGQDVSRFGNILPPMVTTQGSRGCTELFPGTSATAAMGAGIISLVLQANPKLTWRDVQHIIVRAARPITSRSDETRWRRGRPSWNRNSAGLLVSSDFGFGLMDARKMIAYAKRWQTVPQQLSCEVQLNVANFNFSRLLIPWRGDLPLTLSLKQENCSIQYLEHMQAEVNVVFPRRGYLEMFSTSPSGTRSKLLYSRKIDVLTGRRNLTDWRVTSLHYWGEKPFGDWNFTIRSARPWSNLGPGRVFGLKIILYGTSQDPLQINKHVDSTMKRVAISNINQRERDIPIHGGYSQWNYWRPCSRSCDGGLQYRYRYCNNPRPQNDGRNCSGNARERRTCNTHRCPVHGGFTPWSSWGRCSATCGEGFRRRSRTCTNPRPAYGGRRCIGGNVQSQRCALNRCPPGSPVDGGYTQWSSWSGCTPTCVAGNRQRSRSCTNPRPANGGRRCRGPAVERRTCNRQQCPAACSDSLNGCRYWHCSYPNARTLCKKTCGVCRVCQNTVNDLVCNRWFLGGHCSKPTVAFNYCQNTCRTC
ncbi:furin-like protease kpc-1 isoform X2 [Acropora muricata]